MNRSRPLNWDSTVLIMVLTCLRRTRKIQGQVSYGLSDRIKIWPSSGCFSFKKRIWPSKILCSAYLRTIPCSILRFNDLMNIAHKKIWRDFSFRRILLIKKIISEKYVMCVVLKRTKQKKLIYWVVVPC
jgi:hypothetical protein